MPAFDDGREATELPTTGVVETDVLVVGSGPAGCAAALFLATLGIPTMIITKYRWTANTPRAHITNQRAMEVFRDLGIEDQVLADATPHDLVGDTVFCTSLAGEEIGRIRTWGTGPTRQADYQLASPCLTSTSRRPTSSRSSCATRPLAAPRPGSPPSTCRTPRTTRGWTCGCATG